MKVNQPGPETFIELRDVPNTYSGSATKTVAVNSGATGLEFVSGGGGSGTVTSVSVTTANGVSGTVADPTTTPAISLTLGAITPSSVASSGAVTGSNLSGTNTGDVTLSGTPDYITISGQTITRNAVDLAADVTGDLPFTNIEQIATDRILGRDTTGTGDIEALTVGGGIEFSGSGGIQTSAFTGDATKTSGGTALTLASVNSNVGTFGTATQVATVTVNAKGLVTSASNTSISVPSTAVTDFTEASQDSVGAMLDTTLVYNDATPLLSRAALTGAITASAGSNATLLGSFTLAQLNSALSDADVATGGGTVTGTSSGTNTGDQTSIVGITGTIAQFNTALTDGDFATGGGTVTGTSSGTNTGDQNLFQTIAVSGQSNVVADSTTDILTLVAGTNITITTDAGTDSITINSTGGGVSDGDKGDITVTSSGTVWTIDNGVVTAAKTSITGTPDGTKYLRDDFSWQAVAGGSGLTSPQVLARASLCV